MIPALLFAMVVHELGHGYVAYKFGDNTPKLAGRLTLNPLPHLDPIGSIFLPALLIIFNSPLLFGWAKPIPINPSNFKKINIRLGSAIVSFAGAGMNLLSAFVFGILFQILSSKSALGSIAETLGVGFVESVIFPLLIFFKYAVSINVILALFNLLPIPPLDGGKIVMSFLPPHLEAKMLEFENYGFIIIIVLLMLGVINAIILPPYFFLVSLFSLRRSKSISVTNCRTVVESFPPEKVTTHGRVSAKND
jgi:Zn-dependent protease